VLPTIHQQLQWLPVKQRYKLALSPTRSRPPRLLTLFSFTATSQQPITEVILGSVLSVLSYHEHRPRLASMHSRCQQQLPETLATWNAVESCEQDCQNISINLKLNVIVYVVAIIYNKLLPGVILRHPVYNVFVCIRLISLCFLSSPWMTLNRTYAKTGFHRIVKTKFNDF